MEMELGHVVRPVNAVLFKALICLAIMQQFLPFY
jgi:hypothetical protein